MAYVSGKRQSPICTDYSVTLVLACSATPVGRIPDIKHWHCFYGVLFRLATSGMGLPHLSSSTIVGRKTRWIDFTNQEDKKVVSSGANY